MSDVEVFERADERYKSLARLFQALAAVYFDGKGFQVVLMHFDLFRASLNLPVVPQGVNVGLPPTNSKSVVWYYRLRFSGMQLMIETGDLLKTVTREEDGKKSRHVVATALKPSQSSYYCPVLSGRPCSDRAFVAFFLFGNRFWRKEF